ncbi:hypothetical protein D3C75_969870 [compost metagenome]
MQTVDVQQIDGAIGEVSTGLVKGHSFHFGEMTIRFVMDRLQLIVDFLVIKPSVLIAHPGVHGKSTHWKLKGFRCLAKCAIRITEE